MAREGVSRLGKYWKQAIGNRSGIRPRDGGVRDGGAAGKSEQVANVRQQEKGRATGEEDATGEGVRTRNKRGIGKRRGANT